MMAMGGRGSRWRSSSVIAAAVSAAISCSHACTVDGRGAVGPGDLLADSAGYGVASAVAALLALEPAIPWLEVSD